MLNEVKYYLQTDVLIQAFSLTVVPFCPGVLRLGLVELQALNFGVM